jgi:hypothetical protein
MVVYRQRGKYNAGGVLSPAPRQRIHIFTTDADASAPSVLAVSAGVSLAEMAATPRWVAWQAEERGPGGAPTKVPYSPRAAGKARADDPTTWGARADAEARADRLPKPLRTGGIGFVLGDLGDGGAIGGVDLDSCRDDDGVLAPWAAAVVERLASYVEVSPSGTGVKVFFTFTAADLPVLREAMGTAHGKMWKRPVGGDHPPAIELHLGNRYFAVTDQQLPDEPAELMPVALDTLLWLIREAGPAFAGTGQPGTSPERHHDESRSAVAFRKGAALRRVGATFDGMCAALAADPETADWYREKGEANGRRELRRIWERTESQGVDALMAELNADYMVVLEAGKTVIYRPDHDPVLNRLSYTRITFADFRNLYLNRLVAVGTDAQGQPIHRKAAEVWLAHPDRKQYLGGVVFDPSRKHTRPDALNLWQGFAIDAKPGSWLLMQEHIRTVICRGQPDRYDYLIGWMARMVQRPAEQGEVAVVMRGAEGTGKGTLARALMRLLGQHGLAISNARHLVGNFNAHLRDCVFLFADEAFYAGDKQHVGVLKSLITEPHLTIESKYQNTVQSPNYLHLVLASNEEWVVPASLEARRFLMLEVADDRRNDHVYFGAIWAEMDAGGYAAMLHDLLAYDLTRFNVFDFPRTVELGEQKKLSMDTTHRWWMEVLQRGYVHESRCGMADQFTQWTPQLTTGLLYLSYTAYAVRQHERRPISREVIGRFMRSVGATPVRITDGIIGEELTRTTDDDGRMVTMGRVVTHGRAGGYALGSLVDARAAFTTATGLSVEWEDVGGETGEEEGGRQLELKVSSPMPPTTDPTDQTTDNAGDDPWNVGPPAGLEEHWRGADDALH